MVTIYAFVICCLSVAIPYVGSVGSVGTTYRIGQQNNNNFGGFHGNQICMSTLLNLSLYSEQSIAPCVVSYGVKSPLNYFEEDYYLWHEVDRIVALMATTGTATF